MRWISQYLTYFKIYYYLIIKLLRTIPYFLSFHFSFFYHFTKTRKSLTPEIHRKIIKYFIKLLEWFDILQQSCSKKFLKKDENFFTSSPSRDRGKLSIIVEKKISQPFEIFHQPSRWLGWRPELPQFSA